MNEDSVTIVTGAASGIGLATARRLSALGLVVATDLDPRALEEAFAEDETVRVAAADVSLESDVESLIKFATGEGGPIGALVNVAGIGSTTDAVDTDLDAWNRVMAVNAGGTFLCCKHAIRSMRGTGGGTVVNIASIAGLVGLRKRAAYCASKGAVVALTRALAIDHVDEGVRVNAVCPGTVESPWVRRLVEESGESLEALRARQPIGRLGAPEEIADAVVYLLGAEFATGAVLVVDGGLTAF